MIYNTDYFFELLVTTSEPQAVGYISNWDQDKYDSTGNGFVFNYRIYDADPFSVTAKFVRYGESEYFYVDLTWQSVSPNTILVY